MAVCVAVDEGVVTRNGNVIDDSNVTVLPSTNLNLAFIWVWAVDELLCVNNVEYLLFIIVETFEDYEVFRWLINADDVHDLIFVSNLERQKLFAYFAVDFVELEHDLALMHLSLTFRLQPRSEAFQMNCALCSHTLARRNKWVWLFFIPVLTILPVFCLGAPTDLADGFFRLLGHVCRTDSSGSLVAFLRDEDLVAICINRHRVLLLLCWSLFLFIKSILIKCAPLYNGSCATLRLFYQLNLIQIDRSSNVVEFFLISSRLIIGLRAFELGCRTCLLAWSVTLFLCWSWKNGLNGLDLVSVVYIAHP